MKTADARFITVAADADLAAVRRYAMDLPFPTLIDPRNDMARILCYRAIPNGYLFGPDGTMKDELVTRFDLREPTVADAIRNWLRTGFSAEKPPPRPGLDDATQRALELFSEGSSLWDRGQRELALARWHAAYLLDRKSFVIRKQIWRALYPDRFGENIDLAWQQEQISREETSGFGAANPALPPPDPAESTEGGPAHMPSRG